MGRYYKCEVLLVLIEIAQICLCVSSNIPCIEKERQALLDFKASIAHDSPNKLSSWKDTHCCQWEGIGCDNVTGHVIKLDLNPRCYPNCSVSAPNVTSSLLKLEHLTYLDLSRNNFSGSPIPMFLGSMGRLEYLALSNAGFSGKIPISLGNPKFVVTRLQMDDDTSWISKLHLLKHLDLSYVMLNHTHNLFQVLNLLPSLSRLHLSYCEIVNSLIPRYAFQNMTSLVSLDLSFNALHGPIPDAFRNMSSIESLYLSINSLTSIPSWLAELKRLVYLDLAMNQLTLTKCFLSSIITNMCHLKVLDLYRNKLQGELMGNYELSGCLSYDLEALDLKYNEISDRLPTWLGQLQNLKSLDFGSNFFYGHIPLSIGQLSKLEELDLSKNLLKGVLLSNIGQHVNLTRLDISSNKFDGSIPQSLWKLVDLNSLDLSNNSFNEIISENIGQLVNLTYLNLSSNKLDDSIPQSLGKLTYIDSLFLSNNSFNGLIHEKLISRK